MTSRKRRGGKTASELLKELANDPEYVRRRQEQDAKREALDRELGLAERPIIADLRAIGVAVDSVWDLVNTSAEYTEALPTLVDHLRREYPDRIKSGLARALAVRAANFAFRDLVAEYHAASRNEVQQGLAVAIAASATATELPEIIALARDVKLGGSRVLLLSALGRIAGPQAGAALREFSTDPLLGFESRKLLRNKRKKF